MAKAVEELLADKRVSNPFAAFSPHDEKAPAKRVCDDAYLLLRRLLNYEEGADAREAFENHFLKMEVAEKDAEIKKLLTTKRWTSLEELEQGDR